MEEQVACMTKDINIYRNLHLKDEGNNHLGDPDGDEKNGLWRTVLELLSHRNIHAM
jgi:hypothetical protein